MRKLYSSIQFEKMTGLQYMIFIGEMCYSQKLHKVLLSAYKRLITTLTKLKCGVQYNLFLSLPAMCPRFFGQVTRNMRNAVKGCPDVAIKLINKSLKSQPWFGLTNYGISEEHKTLDVGKILFDIL